MSKNSNVADLKRERRSLLGKIDRRHGTILILRHEMREMETRLRLVEEQLAEYKPARKRP